MKNNSTEELGGAAPGNTVQYVVLSLIVVFGTFGNAFVIYLFTATSRRGQAGAGFITALAVTDLLSSIFVPMNYFMILEMEGSVSKSWKWGRFLCYSLPSLNALFVTASAWLLTAISLERMR